MVKSVVKSVVNSLVKLVVKSLVKPHIKYCGDFVPRLPFVYSINPRFAREFLALQMVCLDKPIWLQMYSVEHETGICQ